MHLELKTYESGPYRRTDVEMSPKETDLFTAHRYFSLPSMIVVIGPQDNMVALLFCD